jgi:SAM-dependent methyltransferase
MNETNHEPSSSQSTYFFDQESSAEFVRLLNQDRFITRAMGGAQAGWPEIPEEATILDVACGPGGWVLDVAYALPDAAVCGVDISSVMIEYANARARSQGIPNASFGVMDITHPLDFASGSFDLIHARFLTAVLKREAWVPFIAECTRLLRPGGFLQLVEGNDAGRSLSPALEQLNGLGMQALWQAGYGFSHDGRTFGMFPGLLRLLKQASYQDLHLSTTILDHCANSEGWADFFHNQEFLLHEIKPLLLTTGLITEEEFDLLFQQAIIEMHQDDFAAVGQIMSLWGRK